MFGLDHKVEEVSMSLSRFVTKLLEDLVFFVVDIPNSGQDVLEIMVNKPNRERQKLMREQNILKQVGLVTFFQNSSRTVFFPPDYKVDIHLPVSVALLPTDLQAPAGPVHGQRRRPHAAAGGAGGPETRPLQAHLQALLPRAAPLPAGLPQEPGEERGPPWDQGP